MNRQDIINKLKAIKHPRLIELVGGYTAADLIGDLEALGKTVSEAGQRYRNGPHRGKILAAQRKRQKVWRDRPEVREANRLRQRRYRAGFSEEVKEGYRRDARAKYKKFLAPKKPGRLVAGPS